MKVKNAILSEEMPANHKHIWFLQLHPVACFLKDSIVVDNNESLKRMNSSPPARVLQLY